MNGCREVCGVVLEFQNLFGCFVLLRCVDRCIGLALHRTFDSTVHGWYTTCVGYIYRRYGYWE